ncbi:glycoside hydrolase family 18, partial [Porphyromonas sp.]
MKNIKRLALAAGAIVVLGATSCSKWTELEQYKPTDKSGNITTEDYYANLRAFKQSGAPLGFGWFGGWTGVGASMKTQLMGLPDSLGIVSL